MAEPSLVLAWLNDAYSLENTLIGVLESHAKEAEDYPELRDKIQEHLQKTHKHAQMIKQRIQSLGGEASTHRQLLNGLVDAVQSVLPGSSNPETVLRNGISDIGAEHFEIATYTALIAAAQYRADQETAQACREILRDEEEMAGWLLLHLPGLAEGIVRPLIASHG